MNNRARPRDRFLGYSRPNYTPVPDQLFDEQLPDLSGAELKVLLYIIRRTFGFKKDSDNISLNQLLHGITTRAGAQLDRGTGLSRSTLIEALKGLVEKGHIIAEQRASRERGNEATNYRLNVIPVGPRSEIEPGESANRTRLVRKSDPQETARQERDVHLRNSKQYPSSNGGNGQASGPSSENTVRPHGGMIQIAAVLERERRRLEPPAPSTCSDTPRVDAAIGEISREFGDTVHVRSNASQARHLFIQAGMPEEAFVVRLYEARAITRDQATSQGSGTSPRKRMPYMFAVLRDLLGLRDGVTTKER